MNDHVAGALPNSPDTSAMPSNRVALEEIDNPLLVQGIAYWRALSAGRKFPQRSDVTPRALGNLLRNTMLLRVVEGGKDYEYRIVGDAYVMAHGATFQGRCWSDTVRLSPGYFATVKPSYDRVVRQAEAVAMRGWIERGGGTAERIYCEYVFLPLGREEDGVDHILAFAVYVPRDKLDKAGA